MTEITLKIPEAKVSFFMELIQSLGYEYNISEDEISNEHKELVRNRIKTAKKEDYISWSEARKQLSVKH
jgi:hypothetical protein